MIPDFERLLLTLADATAQGAGDPGYGVRVAVDDAHVTVPIESRIASDARLLATLPRGRLATGFQIPLGRVRARFAHGGER